MPVNWRCPLCRAPLQRQGKALACPARHSFDIAREGYVNLLPVGRKRSRDPGDNREMIEARRRVHDADLYRPLAERLAALIGRAVGDTAHVLDLGCGEGYYTGVLQALLPDLSLYGVDISKPAVRLAARAFPGAHFAVASAAAVPLPDHALDAVVSVFAPVTEGELHRLLRPGGCYLKVSPAPRHLWALRELLYDQPRPHGETAEDLPGFLVRQREVLEYPVELEGKLLQDLLAMTPFAYRGRRDNRQRLAKLERLSVGMAFQLQRVERDPAG